MSSSEHALLFEEGSGGPEKHWRERVDGSFEVFRGSEREGREWRIFAYEGKKVYLRACRGHNARKSAKGRSPILYIRGRRSVLEHRRRLVRELVSIEFCLNTFVYTQTTHRNVKNK